MTNLQYKPGLLEGNIDALKWDFWIWGDKETRTAIISCNNGHIATLDPAIHTISPEGVVSPSAVCPFNCNFHVFIKLDGWTPYGY